MYRRLLYTGQLYSKYIDVIELACSVRTGKILVEFCFRKFIDPSRALFRIS